MEKNFNILFYIRKDKSDDQGKAPIYCRVTVNGKRSELALKRYISIQKWNSNKGYANGTTEEVKSLNAFIDLTRSKVYQHHKQLIEDNQNVTAESIKNSLLGIKETQRSLFKIFEEHNSKVKALINKDFAPGTLQRFETAFKHLKAFVQLKYKADDITLDRMDNEFVAEFDYYLRSIRNCGNNTTVKYVKNFKKIIRIALANGWLNKDPFLNYKVKLKKVDRGYLTQEELEKLENKQFGTLRLNNVKDTFLFQCYTGLAYADVKKLSQNDIIKGDDGELWISTHRRKTETSVNVPMLPEAIGIMDKYKQHPDCLYKGLILPVLSNQKMNEYLKEIGDICGINKNLSSHLARHTFATTVTLSNGISLEAVSHMLGHQSLTTTKIYARLLDGRVAEEMKGLKEKMNRKKFKVI